MCGPVGGAPSTVTTGRTGWVLRLERVDVGLFKRDGWCQAVLYASRVSGFLAAWYVVIFTAERYVIVHHPLRKDEFCTKRRARIVVSVVVAIALVLYTPTTWTHDVISFYGKLAVCAPLPRHQVLISVMATVDTLLSCLVPSLLIVILNGRIIHKIRLYQASAFDLPPPCPNRTAAAAAAATMRRRSLVQTSVSASGSMHIKFTTKALPQPPAGPSPNTHSAASIRLHRLRQAQFGSAPATPRHHGGATVVQQYVPAARLARGQAQFRTARMLLVLSSLTVLLNLPTHMFRVQAVVHDLVGGSVKGARGKFTWQELFQLVHFFNFAVNFFVYSCCGRQFRTGLVRLCTRARLCVTRCCTNVTCTATSSCCRCPRLCQGWSRRRHAAECISNDVVADHAVDDHHKDP